MLDMYNVLTFARLTRLIYGAAIRPIGNAFARARSIDHDDGREDGAARRTYNEANKRSRDTRDRDNVGGPSGGTGRSSRSRATIDR